MRIDSLLTATSRHFAEAGIVEAALDARLLLEHLMHLSHSQLLLRMAQPLTPTELAQYQELVEQRRQRIPLQYITQTQAFWSLDFAVSPDVLIPRPETEFLLEQVCATCRSQTIGHALDLGTGSGVIAVVLAKELGSSVIAVDRSFAALQVARRNFRRHVPNDSILPICSDFFSGLKRALTFDLIVSNPPYVAEEEIDNLMPEVSIFEPRLALSGGLGGLHCIKRILLEAHFFLRPGGWLFLEIGADQQQVLVDFFDQLKLPYTDVHIVPDWTGRPRVLRAQRTV